MDVTQYDSIGSSYLVVGELLFKQMEIIIVENNMPPLLRPNAKIIEFACGAGFHTPTLLSWTTSTITAMDISPEMLKIASQNLSAHVASGRVRLTLADGTKPASYAPDKSTGYFDCAFSAWFLNYAKNRSELVAMFATIARNLADDGVCVGVLPHPTDDLDARKKAHGRIPLSRMWPRFNYINETDDGAGFNCHVYLTEKVGFKTTHMKKSVYEAAAREGGLGGKLEWRSEAIEEIGFKGKLIDGFNLTEEEYRIREQNPVLGLLIVWKN